jgi:hypothetical protein
MFGYPLALCLLGDVIAIVSLDKNTSQLVRLAESHRVQSMRGQDFKRRCLLKGMKVIMKNSFLKDHLKGLGKMPAHVMNRVEPLLGGDGADSKVESDGQKRLATG